MIRLALVAAAVAAALAAAPASATIIGGAVTAYGPNPNNINAQFFNLGTPPFSTPGDLDCIPNCTSVGNNDFQKPHLLAFDEKQDIAVGPGGLTLELNGGSTIFLAEGTRVSSHTVVFDPQKSKSLEGYVDFSALILGVLTQSATEIATDDYYGLDAVTYRTPSLRGLEPGNSVTIDGSRLFVELTASTPGDTVRVFTAVQAVPVPAALPLFGAALGLLGLFGLRRRAA